MRAQSLELREQSLELQQQVIALCKNGTHNTISNTTTNNNNNKAFNINFFLNEQCRNAINLSTFVNNIEVSRDDLMNTGRLGFVDGITKIIVDNLKQMSIFDRPIHCTDVKRETIYIKENDQWNREEDGVKLNGVIKDITSKSLKTLSTWKQENPDYVDGDSEFSQMCIPMMKHSMAGYDRDSFYPKVIRSVSKEVAVSKDVVVA
jgi:hypothetical protein